MIGPSDLDYYQWFVLAGLMDHPDMTDKCSSLWFADKPRRRELFDILCGYKRGPVCLSQIWDKSTQLLPTQIFSIGSGPRPYREKLTRYIGFLSDEIQRLADLKVRRVS